MLSGLHNIAATMKYINETWEFNKIDIKRLKAAQMRFVCGF
jgi:hypothetical protein